MRERVGVCSICKLELYCVDGFFQGVIMSDGSLQCFQCHERHEQANNSEHDHEL